MGRRWFCRFAPLRPFAAIGDMGSGERPQYETAAKMIEMRAKYPYEFVIMLGDNIYGGNSTSDYQLKFEAPTRRSSMPGSASMLAG
jgi:hypothetical protein